MIRLNLTATPQWLDLTPGLRLLVGPLTTALMVSARADPAIEALADLRPETALVRRGEGWEIEHIDVPMTQHDLAITTFKAYCWRAFRSGIAYAEVAERMRLRGDPLWQHDARRDFRHGGIAGRGRRPICGEPTRRRAHHRLTHRVNGVFAVSRWSHASPLHSWMGAGAHRPSYALQPTDCSVGCHRGGG